MERGFPVETQRGQVGRHEQGCSQCLGRGSVICGTCRRAATHPAPTPGPPATLLRGRVPPSCSVVQTGNCSSESPGHRVQATQLMSRVPGCSLQVQALVSCTPTFTHTPAWLLRLWSLRTPRGLGERHGLNNRRKTPNNLSLVVTSMRWNVR